MGRRRGRCSTCFRPVKGHPGPTGKGCSVGFTDNAGCSLDRSLEGYIVIDEYPRRDEGRAEADRVWWDSYSGRIDGESPSFTRGRPGEPPTRVILHGNRGAQAGGQLSGQERDSSRTDSGSYQGGQRPPLLPSLDENLTVNGHGLPSAWSDQVPLYNASAAPSRQGGGPVWPSGVTGIGVGPSGSLGV